MELVEDGVDELGLGVSEVEGLVVNGAVEEVEGHDLDEFEAAEDVGGEVGLGVDLEERGSVARGLLEGGDARDGLEVDGVEGVLEGKAVDDEVRLGGDSGLWLTAVPMRGWTMKRKWRKPL